MKRFGEPYYAFKNIPGDASDNICLAVALLVTVSSSGFYIGKEPQGKMFLDMLSDACLGLVQKFEKGAQTVTNLALHDAINNPSLCEVITWRDKPISEFRCPAINIEDSNGK
jgi:hypothetical protein